LASIVEGKAGRCHGISLGNSGGLIKQCLVSRLGAKRGGVGIGKPYNNIREILRIENIQGSKAQK
jgi:hypothetical protein